MAILKNNYDTSGTGDRNEIGLTREQAGDNKKSNIPKFRSLHGCINDGGIFQKHAERMLAFCKSHIIYQHAITNGRTEEPTPPVGTAGRESGILRELPKAQDWQLWFKENKAVRHQFSAN